MGVPRRLPQDRPHSGVHFVPTEEQRHLVQVLSGMGVPRKTIARLIPGGSMTADTLARHFHDDLVNGRETLIASLKHDIVKSAKRGSVRAQTWLLERLDPDNFGRALGAPSQDTAIVPIVSDAKVEIYLPDNQRANGDLSPVTMFSEPPVIDGEPIKAAGKK